MSQIAPPTGHFAETACADGRASPGIEGLSPYLPRVVLVLFGILLFGVASSWERVMSDVPFGSITEPVSVAIGGLGAADRERIQVTYLPPHGPKEKDLLSFETIPTPREGFSWLISFRAVHELHITASSDVLHRIQSVHLAIGGKHISFDAQQFAVAWRPVPVVWEALDRQTGSEVTVAWPNDPDTGRAINFRTLGDFWTAVSRRAMATIAVCWCLCLLVILAMRRRRGTARPAEYKHAESPVAWLAIGAAVFCIAIAITRSREPYALTQDDNLTQFLPVIIRSASDFFQGRFPVWNPHQLLGAPTATVGTYMLTYPPTYVSYWIARSVFGDPYLTLEVFTILHLAAGYLVFFQVLRRFGLRPSLAAAGAVSFTLSAFFLIGGRSQCTFVPAAVWLPLLARSVLALERGRGGWKWAVATGAVAGAYFHAGHAQLWFYGLTFFAAAAILLAAGGRLPWRRALWCVPALCFGAALAAPLLLLQMIELSGRHWGSSGAGVNLLGMLVPLGRAMPDIRLLFTEPAWSGQIPYFGTLFAAAGLIGLGRYFYLLVLCRLPWKRARTLLGETSWLILMLLAALLAAGPDGVLWPLMAHVPPFSDFRWPVKLLPFVALFAAIGGGLVLERWCARRRPGWAQWLAAAALALVVLNSYWARASWYSFGDRPYPKLDPSYGALIAPPVTGSAGRILTRPHWSLSPAAGFFRTQALNYATVTGALSAGGYDTFVEATDANRLMLQRLNSDPVPAARAYGVRWVIWDQIFSHPAFSVNPACAEFEMPTIAERKMLFDVRRQAVLALSAGGLDLYRTGDADALAFVSGPGKKPLDVRFDMRGATVDATAAPAGAVIVVNVLWRPWMKAFADGRLLEAHPDEWGRVEVPLPRTARVLSVLYRPPWALSTLGGIGLALAGLSAGYVLRGREKRALSQSASSNAPSRQALG